MKIKANDGKTYEVPDNPVWHSGPPPEIGWWPASLKRNLDALRFWNGHHWSMMTYPDSDASNAGYFGNKQIIGGGKKVQWTDRWWLKGGK